MQIKDRTFVISGGSSGLGLATALLLAQHGAYISILDLNPPPSDASLPEHHILFTSTDVSSTDSLQAALHATLKWTNSTSAPLSGIVCSAGIGTAGLVLPKQPPLPTTKDSGGETQGGATAQAAPYAGAAGGNTIDAAANGKVEGGATAQPTPYGGAHGESKGTKTAQKANQSVKYYDMQSFDRTLAINLRGTVDLIRLAVPHMALNDPWGPDGERGVIVVVSSVAAYEGQVGQLAYSASKGAVRSIVLPLARELGQKAGVRVMGVAPGVFETGMTVPKPKPKSTTPKSGGKATAGATAQPTPYGGASGTQKEEKQKKPTGARAGVNSEMVNYPVRMGKGEEFARLVKEIVENPMLNGFVVRLDGGVRMPTRL
jgi:NAD(P)-dependent dehydrogenase (short-subunit alcohol dehydrogenase family)